jgi:hypothetical protein
MGVMEGEVWQDMAADVEGDLHPEDLQARCCYGAVENINFIVYKKRQETYIQVLLHWVQTPNYVARHVQPRRWGTKVNG